MRFAIWVRVSVLAGLFCALPAWSAPAAQAARLKGASADVRTQLKSGTDRKLGSQLSVLRRQAMASSSLRKSAGNGLLAGKLRGLLTRDGYVSVSAYPESGTSLAALKTALTAKGMLGATQQESAVSGRVPVTALADIGGMQGLHFLRPAMAMTRSGLVTTQGDRSMRADSVRKRFHVDGRGVTIGVMSDSYDCAPGAFAEGAPFTRAADDIANNDLPRDVTILKDLSSTPSDDCIDEGRAMMQLIHDVAPAASLAFYTAFESAEDFAFGIGELAKAGANIIVDDVIYFAEPMFQDGPIAQAADKVVSKGVAFFSSAGNDGRQSYESRFRDSGFVGVSLRPVHDFDSRRRGVDPLQSVTAQAGSITLLSFQWDQPFFSASGKKGSASDLDAYFLGADNEFIEVCTDDPDQVVCQVPGFDFNIGGDAIELPILVNLSDTDIEAQLVIELFNGSAPNLMKYVYFDLGPDGVYVVNEFDTQSGTAYGHTNAANVEAIGAAPFYNTEEFGQNKPECLAACLENFSSAGGVLILFNKNGHRLKAPELRIKPGVTGPDGGNTTFFFFDLDEPIPGTTEPDGFPNFFGTSASAPHVAAIGALMLDKRQRDIDAHKQFVGPKRLSPEAMYLALRLTAQDIRARAGIDSGPFPIERGRRFDFDSGFGFVDAWRAIHLISGF
jgi:subtilisin family serine protease